MMKSVVVDKIASVTQACGLAHELRIATEIPAEEGTVLVVEVLTNKSTYNTLELTSGRMAKVSKGDVIVGALGHRKALFGYSGHLPEQVAAGDVIQLLNIGGVLGICDSVNPDKGKPFDCRVLGVVLTFPYLGERIGVPAKVGYKALDYNAELNARGVPVVALAGTCMEAGKTAAACSIVSRMRHRGLVVDAFKATGGFAPPRHPLDGRLGRVPFDDLHGSRHRHDDAEKRAPPSRARCSRKWRAASPM